MNQYAVILISMQKCIYSTLSLFKKEGSVGNIEEYACFWKSHRKDQLENHETDYLQRGGGQWHERHRRWIENT